ncbi:hypothetical protein DWB84_11535 [Saccharophagus sp. K07]|uniref:hypothetical protein n=1 Tax=Saccharophagus sp. K07 TaxID=2283636 RepID=UPI0016527825|nr:hypothetical protein [Saccharophagus sp. K07]MBC6906091.1 hypothetical protein [Saccharophagus sp. K07]
MKQAGSMFLLTTASFIANFVVFIYAYRFLALPPNLLETQRIENAPLIFSYVFAGFLGCAILRPCLRAFYIKGSSGTSATLLLQQN